MEVRELKIEERQEALRIIWEVFLEGVAPSYTQEGIDRFEAYLAKDHIDCLCDAGELTMFGAFDGGELAGTISIQSGGHICNFYVKHSCQGKGAGSSREVHPYGDETDCSRADGTWEMLYTDGAPGLKLPAGEQSKQQENRKYSSGEDSDSQVVLKIT